MYVVNGLSLVPITKPTTVDFSDVTLLPENEMQVDELKKNFCDLIEKYAVFDFYESEGIAGSYRA